MAEEKSASIYWPSLDEYNPGITKEMWEEVLKDASITTPETFSMLKMMLELGGESTCARLAEVYGNTFSYYNRLGSAFGKRVKDKYNCPDCIDKESDTTDRNRVYVIPFVGRNVKENGNQRYSWKLRDELKEALESMELSKIVLEESATDVELNTILYGPPGTGKTYHTAKYAVAIIENKKLADISKEDYDEVLVRYNEYKASGHIVFTTFHQSYGYEEFIEGIKPCVYETNGKKEVYYDIIPGIFKTFCQSLVLHKSHKVSFDEAWNALLNDIKKCNNEVSIKRDRVTKTLRWNEKNQKFYDTVKGMEYLYADRQTVESYMLNQLEKGEKSGAKAHIYYNSQGIYQILKDKYHLDENPPTRENKVFIIDEINRGNISKIFGELITLIEPSKRIGASEEMTAVLPYSAKPFGIPNNIYIIGTMNTADRSIATIDTALRRRFYFKEMLPNPDVLKDVYVEDLSIGDLLARINKRIAVLYDREHTIGHAYFMALKASPTIDTLAKIFENNIIPLLQEYFYEDYEKIRLVLGDNKKDEKAQFIVAKPNDYAALFGNVDVGLDDGYRYEINPNAFNNIEAYRSI